MGVTIIMESWVLWLIATVIVSVILLSLPLIQRWFNKVERDQEPVVVGGGRRARPAVNEEEEREDETNIEKKIGTKKRKKIAEKAEKKALREQEEALRQEEKKREKLRYEEQKKLEAEEEMKLKKKEEEEKERKELQEKKEYEEYLKLKADFIIEEEGYIQEDTNDKSLTDFIQYIKNTKVVFMEELAAEFNLKTQSVIDRIHKLQLSGELTGVIDERGKFIYITLEELKTIAKFIRQRGRVTLSELADSSNNLIKH